jgi:hypothetical protein
MTSTGSSRSDLNGSPVAAAEPRRRTGWTGWVVFAGLMLLLNGCIQVLQGLMALVNEDFYAKATEDLPVSLSYDVWGWAHLLLGVALLATGIGVLSGNVVARAVGVGVASINALVALAFIDAAPGWGILVIAVDVTVIYALTVHGGELRDAPL